MKLSRIVRGANQWLSKTPERALDQAYRAALKIKELEDKHFQGKKVSPDTAQYGDSVMTYFEAELQGYLQTIKVRLGVFKTSRLFTSLSEPTHPRDERIALEQDSHGNRLLQKLKFIDDVISKYKTNEIVTAHSSDNGVIRGSELTPLNQQQVVIEANGKVPPPKN